MKRKVGTAKKPLTRRLLLLAIAVIGLYIVLPQLGDFRQSLVAIRHAQLSLVLFGLLALAGTFLAATIVYLLLAFKPLKFGATLLVQIAANFTNRLLPAGIGAIGLNYQFLRRSKHTSSESAAVVTANNTLGFIGNMLLLLLLIATTSTTIDDVHLPHIPISILLIAGSIILFGLALISNRLVQRLTSGIQALVKQVGRYHRRPGALLAALLVSMVLTSCFAGCLYACCHAVGLQLSYPTVLIVMSLGVAGGTVTPTPGGLGGVEAGLVAGFILYGSNAADALAAALLYRLITYWLALVIGISAFVVAQRQRII